MAYQRLSDLERAAFTQIEGNPTMNIEVVEGTEEPVPEMRLSELQRNAFTMIDGKVTVRSNVVGGGGGAGGAALTQVSFDAASWIAPSPADGTLRLMLTHSLDTTNINVDFYETGKDGTIDIPWESNGVNAIMACIPTGFAFNGLARISSRNSTAPTVAGFQTSFIVNDWVAQNTMPETYVIAFTHNQTTLTPEYEMRRTDGSKVIIMPNIASNERITFTVLADERFAGYIHVRK